MMNRAKGLRHEIRDGAPLQDGQTEREVTIVRRTKIQSKEVEISAPSELAKAVSSIYGTIKVPLKGAWKYREKAVGREVERFRWMKPDGKGGLVPRDES